MIQLKLFTPRSVLFVVFITCVFIAFANNQVLIATLYQRIDWLSLQGGGYVLGFFMLLITLLWFLSLLLSLPYITKPFLMLLLFVSAILSYFHNLGVVFDVDMIRNVLETIKDNNQQEALELLSLPLITHLTMYALLPSLLLSRIPLVYQSFIVELRNRTLYIVGSFILVIAVLLLNFKYVTYFSRENRDLRLNITPLYALTSVYKTIRANIKQKDIPFVELGHDATQMPKSARKNVGIMVVGETARADHFSLNGYARETNPYLAATNAISFNNVYACGTSTAFSVPCMFSFLGREQYHPDKAAVQSNVLDVLSHAGVKVIWVDNNSSCKGVCARIQSINLRENPNPESPFYAHGQYYDEILLEDLDHYIEASDSDILLVLHSLGSHGPSYYKRYPKDFAKYTPNCEQSTPQLCSQEQIINTYDNTILYTDYVLAKMINYLKDHEQAYNSFLFYASDHGESLGEKGIYLHGLPYFLAPDAQLHIPMIAWFSEGFSQQHQIDLQTIVSLREQAYSHDYLTHSLLALFNVKTQLYQAQLNLFSPPIQANQVHHTCRSNTSC